MGWHPRHGNPDQNQPDIVDLVRELPASVQVTTGIGYGFPDLVIGFQALTILAEIKRKGKKEALRRSQEDFIRRWRGGPVLVADDGQELVQQLIALDRGTPQVRGLGRFKAGTAQAIIDDCLEAAKGAIVDEHDLAGYIRKLRGAA